MDRDAFVPRLFVAGSRAPGAEQTRHGPRDAFVRFVVVLDIWYRDAFVQRLFVAGSRASGAEQTRHGPRDAFVRFVVVLGILSTTNKRVTWTVTRLFRVCSAFVRRWLPRVRRRANASRSA